METLKLIVGKIVDKIGFKYITNFTTIKAIYEGYKAVAKDILDGIDLKAKSYQSNGKNREVAYTEAMHDMGLLDDDEYRRVMAAIK